MPSAPVSLVALVAATAFAADPAPPAPADPIAAQLSDVASSWLFRKATSGLQVVDLATGEEVFGRNADALLIPASTMKIVTAATALHHLGPSYRFTTDVSYTGTLDAAGTLHGDLYVVGHGDPTFVVETLWKMVTDLRLHGVRHVDGAVRFDDTFFDDQAQLPGWNKPEDAIRGTPYYATLGALSINQNTAVLVIGPGAAVGQPAEVLLETPSNGYVELDNQLTTVGAGGRKFVDIEREATEATTKFTLEGTFPIDEAERLFLRRTVADPTAHFLSVFRAMAESQGITATGRWTEGEAPDDAEVLMTVESPPLSAVLADMNKNSLNFHAEQVLRVIGAEVNGEGSTAAGLRAVSDYLGGLGVAPEDVALVNGSGLAREARLKPSVLTAVLMDMAHDRKVGAEFASSLAIGGVDGTLWARMRNEPGRLRGKTGTLDEVIGLTGFVDAADGRRFAFAWLVNDAGSRLSSVRDEHDDFAQAMFDLGASGSDR